ncbi:MAG TPA: SEC-C metal-binding domain-containing protein [Thermoguttaceae bacterium]|nr:SEC-C metal-binding domain-containing protein [Thermoguttaceae bacterium]
MDSLERVWEFIAGFFAGLSRAIERAITSLFGSSNARYLKRLQGKVVAINALEPKLREMTDAELREQTEKFRRRLAAGETLDDLLVEAFAVCREAGRRVLGMRHFDVQLMGGMVLHSANIAEMVTGEGKTLVATLPAYLNALLPVKIDAEGRPRGAVHVVTVNDYLARRDMEWMGPLYMALGLTVGTIQSNMDNDARQKAYDCDITYGTNNEFGFDYLRDNMRPAARGDVRYPKYLQQVQGPLHFAVVDEVDNILIDEARTPLIISGPAHDDVTRYAKADRIARQLTVFREDEMRKGETEQEREARKEAADCVVNPKEHSAHLTDQGVRRAEEISGVESFYTAGNMEWPHLIDNSLKAHHLYKRDVNYVIQGDEIIIVDEFTGRLMPGRNWSDGLHQAVEAKEGVRIKEENQTLATITLQNYFKLYDRICGMTGTAMTEAAEFYKIYKLDVIAIPTNRPLHRLNFPDVIYRAEKEKYKALVDEIEQMHKFDVLWLKGGQSLRGQVVRESDGSLEFQAEGERQHQTIPRDRVEEIERRGRPILVGTVSIERSELISAMLDRCGVKHQVLNAKHHQREAEIVAQAGRKNAVTIATNMAGRGTDIILGGNPEAMAWAQLQEKYATRLDVPREEWDALIADIEAREQTKPEGREVAGMGGLHIIGTERHEARRIDLQLRGRCGRQGDPGSSRFYLSLEDDLMRIFAGEWVKNILTRLGMKEGEAIESRMVSRRIEGAQKKVEERNFEVRKNLLEYDEVMDEQRKRVYGYRQMILDGTDCKQLILDMVDQQIEHYLKEFLNRDYGSDTFTQWAGSVLSVELDPRDFRRMEFAEAESFARDKAEGLAESQVHEAIEENLPEDDDPREWNWVALAKVVDTRWRMSLRDRDLKKIGRENLAEELIEKARAAVRETDLSQGVRFLEPDFGVQTACAWVKHKFGVDLPIDEYRDLEYEPFRRKIAALSREVYHEKELEFPIMAGLYHFTTRDASGHKRYDREKLAAWARERFQVELDLEDLRNKQRDEIRALLIEQSRTDTERARQTLEELNGRLDAMFPPGTPPGTPPEDALETAARDGRLQPLADWMADHGEWHMTVDQMAKLAPAKLRFHCVEAIEDRYRPEMRKMERALVLQLLDAAWKDHLLAMDHLKSSIGLRGYAQVDPKVEYKREGMKTFDAMWQSVGERVTDLVYRMEQLDESFVGSTWTEAEAIHEEAPSADEITDQQQAAIDGTQADRKLEPFRRRGERVGRNDPCPCGSGKKYKSCCMRKGA